VSAEEKPFGVPGTGGSSEPRSDEQEREAARNANRFDIRRLIGGVFILYGLIMTLLGIFGSTATKHKAAGININLWTGLAMLVFGGLMVFWALARPVSTERPEPESQGSGQAGGATAT